MAINKTTINIYEYIFESHLFMYVFVCVCLSGETGEDAGGTALKKKKALEEPGSLKKWLIFFRDQYD